jgi:diguanylate cyclase (GGDEF)-like protein
MVTRPLRADPAAPARPGLSTHAPRHLAAVCGSLAVAALAAWGPDRLAGGLAALTIWVVAASLVARAGRGRLAGFAVALGFLALREWPGMAAHPAGFAVAIVAPLAAVVYAGLALPTAGTVVIAALGAGTAILRPLPGVAGGEGAVLAGVVAGSSGALALLALFRSELTRATARAEETSAELARLRLAGRGGWDGAWHWELRTGRVHLSPGAAAILGLAPADVHAAPAWLAGIAPDDAGRVAVELDDFAFGRSSRLALRARVQVDEAPPRWILLRGEAERDALGHAERMAGTVLDVTEWQRREDELVHGAFRDSLTALPNRSLFMNRLAHAFARSRRSAHHRFALLFLDLDSFKLINDSLGHRVGDLLLADVARRLALCTRPADTLARLGGDEFVVLLENVESAEDGERCADRMQEALRLPFCTGEFDLNTSASIGIALSSDAYSSPDEMLRDADTAMYRAKAEGKARHCVFAPGMRERVLARMSLERDLHRALEEEQFVVHFQPIVDLATGRIGGFEALVRWQQPNGRLVPPGQFIPMAEETGQVVPLTWWIVRNACGHLRRWRTSIPGAEELWVNINFSGRQLAHANLCRDLLDVLAEADLPPRALRVEITETAMLEKSGAVGRCISALRLGGIELHVDDFGTGYSSLSHLHRYRLDGLKIDRAFIARLDRDDRPGIVQSIIQLARNLSMTVTAEGVETQNQLDRLRAMGCGKAQGYFFSPGKPAAAIEEMLRNGTAWPVAGGPTPTA